MNIGFIVFFPPPELPLVPRSLHSYNEESGGTQSDHNPTISAGNLDTLQLTQTAITRTWKQGRVLKGNQQAA